MTIPQAAALLQTPQVESARPQIWCDLGSGEGLFTLALANLLTSGSTIYAVDRDLPALNSIPDEHDGVRIRKIRSDLNSDSLQLSSVDGVLIANALHFIPKQEDLLRRLRRITQRFLIVEYEQTRSSRWVPYPVSFEKLRNLFRSVGMHSVTQIATRKSRFGGLMYSAFADSVPFRL